MLAAALDAAGLSRAVIGLGDADLYRQLLDELGVDERGARARSSTASPTHDLVGLEAEVGALDARRRRARDAARGCPTLRGGAEVLERARELGGEAVERATGAPARRPSTALARARRRRPGPARPRPAARPRLLHRRDPRGLRPGARPHPRRRRPLRRADGPLRPRRCPRPASRSTSSALHIAQAEEERLGGGSGRERHGRGADPRRATSGPLKLALPRGALFGGTPRPARRDRRRHRRAARRLALAGLRDRRADAGDDAALRRADLRRGGRRRPRDHRQGRARRAGRPRRLRARSTSATAPAGWCSPARRGDDSLGESERRLGAMRIATKYPRIAERYFERDRPPGRGDRGQGLGRAGAAGRPRRRDRRPRRHRPHPGRERPRGARGDRRLHRAPGRQPRLPQAARRRDRRARRAAAGGGAR